MQIFPCVEVQKSTTEMVDEQKKVKTLKWTEMCSRDW